MTGSDRAAAKHWEETYLRGPPTQASWHQEYPAVSLELLDMLDVGPEHGLIDVGGGASLLVDRLLDRGFEDLSVLDVSGTALGHARLRLGDDAERVSWIRQDVTTWIPGRHYDVWHDRAVFHFLVTHEERKAYLGALRAALVPGARAVVATFAADGPERCSGLPTARYGPEELADVFGADFEVAGARREEHRTPAGVLQAFSWLAMVYQP